MANLDEHERSNDVTATDSGAVAVERTTAARPASRWGIGDAVAGYAAGLFATFLVGGLWVAATGRTSLGIAGLLVTQVALWTGLLGAPLWASRRKGSGSVAADFRFRFRAIDPVIGLPAGVACQLLLVPLIYLPLRRFVDVERVGDPAKNLLDGVEGGGLVLLGLSLAIGAPLVEELFFRGLLLRSLVNRFGAVVGGVSSAAFFGLTHFQLLQFPGLAAFGGVLAFAAIKSDRLGPAVWTHIGFNATTLAVLLSQ